MHSYLQTHTPIVAHVRQQVVSSLRTLRLRAPSAKKRDEWLAAVQTHVQALRDADYATAIAHGEEGAQFWEEKVAPAVWRAEQQVLTPPARGKAILVPV